MYCVGSLKVGAVIKFQDVRDELLGDDVNVVVAQVTVHGKNTTTVRRIGDNKRFMLFNHHAVEIKEESNG